MQSYSHALLIFMLTLLPLFASAREVSLIYLRGGKSYFDGDHKTVPEGERWEAEDNGEFMGIFFEEAELLFSEDITIDRVDIQTNPGAQICYLLKYELHESHRTETRYNGVPGFDVRADSAGVQSIPISPPITTSFLSIRCFLEVNEISENRDQAEPTEVRFFHKGDPLRLVPPIPASLKVEASSTLKPIRVYGADNLFDRDLETVWAEGTPGYGEGSTINFSFEIPQRITALLINNGHQRDREMFSRNGKLKEFTLDGKTYVLANRPGLQVVPLKEVVEKKEITLTVVSHYPGTKYEDLCLSELGFKSGSALYSLQTEGNRKLVEDNRRILGLENLKKFGVNVGERDGLSFDYDTDTARFSFFVPFRENEMETPGMLFAGTARIVKVFPDKVVFNLEGYLDRGDFDGYGNMLVRQSRSAENMEMTVTKPSLLPFDECKRIMDQQGVQYDNILTLHKKFFGKNKYTVNQPDQLWIFEQETWFISPLGFKNRSYFD